MSFLSQVWIRERRDLRVFGRKWLRGKEIKNVEGLFTLFVRLILTPHADLDENRWADKGRQCGCDCFATLKENHDWK